MCLYSYMKKPDIAEHPIECVKIMRRHAKNGEQLYNLFSFVRPTTYKLGVLSNMIIYDIQDMHDFECPELETGYRDSILGNNLYNMLKVAIGKGVRSNEDEIEAVYNVADIVYKYRILQRGICSFIDKKDAQNTFDWAVRTSASYYDICLVKCEIPVGARYWKGVSNCTGLECGYVSDQIIPRKILKWKNSKWG